MDIQSIITAVCNSKGANVRAVWRRKLKVRKGFTCSVEKITRAVVRSGVDYDKRLVVQMKREIGELPEVNAGLPWGSWKQFPWHIEHKGKDYIRLEPSSLDIAPIVCYGMKEEGADTTLIISKEKAKELCLASEFSDTKPLCFTVTADNVEEINDYTEGEII